MITVTSKRFSKELARRHQAFAGLVSAILKVGPELNWVYFQEHGTGAGGKSGLLDLGGKGEYLITAKLSPYLVFRSEDTGVLQFRTDVRSPGVPAHHFIAESIEPIMKMLGPMIVKAMVQSGYDFSTVKEVFLKEGMEEAKQIIAEAISVKLKANHEGAFGKLRGGSPEQAFLEGAQIEDRSE